jgi:alkyl sulfatase BDS1-like metallo-beta-lactamase superfamily hydrolase
MNQGYVGSEIAEMIELPPALEQAWHARGYYGSMSHNVKAVFQRYLGWYSGHPSDLWEHTPTETAKRYAACLGGADEIVAKARGFAEDGDLRFAAQLLKHAVFADAQNQDAKNLLADVFERLAFGAECATWRNCYLVGADELRNGVKPMPLSSSAMATALNVPQLLDSIAIRVNGPKAWSLHAVTDWHFSDLNEHYRVTLENGVLTYVQLDRTPDATADASFTLTKQQFMGLLAGGGADGVERSGDPAVLDALLGVLDEPDPAFAIVTR